MKTNNYYCNKGEVKNHPIKILDQNISLVQAEVSLLIEELNISGSFREMGEAIYNVIWNINDLLQESSKIAWQLSLNKKIETTTNLYRFISQSMGMLALLFHHRQENGYWLVSGRMLERILFNMERLLDKASYIIVQSSNELSNIEVVDNE